jgi:glycosyltransferase involved in cell wall biosynthesis
MKISVVTISYNQARFLTSCIESITVQEGPWEHIIVDPGSSDGSRKIIDSHRAHFSHVVLEKDNGPADGLNRGFARASGDIYYYLNSDDVVFPGAFAEARRVFRENPHVDVVMGHGYVIDASGKRKRRLWSDKISRRGLAVGGCISIQPATFIRARAFERTRGFNPSNRSTWDGELIVDLFLAGSNFLTVDRYWGGFRLHAASITGAGAIQDEMRAWGERCYEKISGKEKTWYAASLSQLYRFKRVIARPSRIVDRLRGGRVFGGGCE